MSRQTTPLPPLDAGQRYSIQEAIEYLRSSRASVYKDIREGRLLSFKERSRRYVPGSELLRRSQAPASAQAAA